MTASVIGAAALAGWWPALSDRVRFSGLGVVCVLVHPLLAAMAGTAALAVLVRKPPSSDGHAQLLLADQVALALRAGLTFEGALREVRADLPSDLASEIGQVLRSARSSGLARALAAATGRGERLYRITDRAVRTGAPLGPAVEALAEELRHEDHARRTADARRLPVRMLLPLALLILPGFVLALVGPALVGSLARLDIGW